MVRTYKHKTEIGGCGKNVLKGDLIMNPRRLWVGISAFRRERYDDTTYDKQVATAGLLRLCPRQPVTHCQLQWNARCIGLVLSVQLFTDLCTNVVIYFNIS